jgi:type III restriction enzyme
MIELRNYQTDAIERLKVTVEGLLRSSENEVCIFQAPTGSGKTIMVAEFLKKLVQGREDQKKFSFVWISVRRLHDQSKDKLERYYEDSRLLKCSYFYDLEDKKIGENEILFVNWDSINKKEINIYVRENEQDNNLSSIIKNTKDEGRNVMLIIDESHHTASSEKSRELIEVISPKITIEVSATPRLKEDVSGIVKVNLSDVKEEEMIKTEISVNPEFMNLKVDSRSADEIVIDYALKKREELARMYKNEGSNVNPLMLVQLPDKREGMEDKKDEVVKILDKKGITERNGKLAVWLSEDKSDTLPNIEKIDNEVEVLIFKQAIALGWDCPRASILVIFRESKSFTFTIQTIGRIMRMPDLKHYTKEQELNKGFVFTNLPNIEITEDYAKDYVTVYESKRRDEIYDKISMNSFYLKRQRERTRLSGEFVKIFRDVASERKIREKIIVKPSRLANPVIADGKIVNIDKTGEIEHKGSIELGLTEGEIQNRFNDFVRGCCSPFAPVDSSDRMKTALYDFIRREFEVEKLSLEAQKIVLGKENVQTFWDTINLAKEKYRKAIVKQSEQREIQKVPNWEVPLIIPYNSRYRTVNSRLSVMKPLYVRSPSEPEQRFEELLDTSSKVKWWFKNGEGEIKYFAVVYKDENGLDRAFYVDFIVSFEDGSIGLFDTKSGITAKDAGPRAEGLQSYIKKENESGKKVWGGIVILVNDSWRYNDCQHYVYDENDLSAWKILSI